MKVLVKLKPLDIIGIYTKDAEGEGKLKTVMENWARQHPDVELGVWEYQTNIPNG